MSVHKLVSISGLLLILITALALASVAAYMSIAGLANTFAAHQTTIVIMAIFIEVAKLVMAGGSHIFWEQLPIWKWLLVGFIMVHMVITNIGIYSYLTSGYLLQKAPEQKLELSISDINIQLEAEAVIIGDTRARIIAMDTAYKKYIDKLFIRRAEKYKKTNKKLRSSLEEILDSSREKTKILQDIKFKSLQKKQEVTAKLGSIEHIAVFAGNNTVLEVVAMFTLLLMLGLDPVAILLVIFFSHLYKIKYSKELMVEPVIAEKLTEVVEETTENIIETVPVEKGIEYDKETISMIDHLDKIGYFKNRIKTRKPK